MYRLGRTFSSSYIMATLLLLNSGISLRAEAGYEHELAARIEMELLGDPLTFPYFWRVRVVSSGVEIAALVPGEDIRERALHLARRIAPVPIYDRIQVQLSPRPSRLPPRSPRELGEAVRHRLELSRLGTETGFAEIDIYPEPSGIVTLRGYVCSLSDKLLASRCLQDLESCIAVRNQIEVRPVAAQAALRGAVPHQTLSEPEEYRPDPFHWRPPRPPLADAGSAAVARQPMRVNASASSPFYPSMRQSIKVASNLPMGVLLPVAEGLREGSIVPPTSSHTMPTNQYASSQTVPMLLPQPNTSLAPSTGNPSNGSIRPYHIQSASGAPTQPLTYPSQNKGAIRPPWSVADHAARFSGEFVNDAAQHYRPVPNSVVSAPSQANTGRVSFSSQDSSSDRSGTGGPFRNYASMRTLPSVPLSTASQQTGETTGPADSFRRSPAGVEGRAMPVTGGLSALQARLTSTLAPDVTDVQILGVSGNSLRLRVKVPNVQALERVAPRLFQMLEGEGYETKPEFEIVNPSPP
ncbi:MAG: BON domain-containing protein [Gemmatales bacterium]|nr:BON domain-containing protein [Gemmatales bacterium]